MAKCEHGNSISECWLCKIERHAEQYGDPWAGEVSTDRMGKSSTRIDKLDYDESCHECEEEYNDMMMGEYVKNSFTTKLEDNNADSK